MTRSIRGKGGHERPRSDHIHDDDEIRTGLAELAAAHAALNEAIIAIGDQLTRLRAAFCAEGEAIELPSRPRSGA